MVFETGAYLDECFGAKRYYRARHSSRRLVPLRMADPPPRRAEGSVSHDRAAAPQALSNPSLDGHCDDVCRGRIYLGEYEVTAGGIAAELNRLANLLH